MPPWSLLSSSSNILLLLFCGKKFILQRKRAPKGVPFKAGCWLSSKWIDLRREIRDLLNEVSSTSRSAISLCQLQPILFSYSSANPLTDFIACHLKQECFLIGRSTWLQLICQKDSGLFLAADRSFPSQQTWYCHNVHPAIAQNILRKWCSTLNSNLFPL